MKERRSLMIFSIPILLTFFSVEIGAQVPAEVKAIEGVYKGTWRMFGLNEKGDIVQKMMWTDIMEAGNPITKDGKAYVTTVDSMTFEGGIPPQKIEGKEGYFLNQDGSLGDYFFESNGQVHRMKKLEDQVWAYTLPSFPMEMKMLGFSNTADAKHVMIKVVSRENGEETHLVSRVTTVIWKDEEGRDCRKQFVSLQGMHKRQK